LVAVVLGEQMVLIQHLIQLHLLVEVVEAQLRGRVLLVALAVAGVLTVAQALLLAAQVHLDKAMLVEMGKGKRLPHQLEVAVVLVLLVVLQRHRHQVMVVLP
jgi:hypothetical protein